MEEYTFKAHTEKAMKALGYDKDELFVKLTDYFFQPFYSMPLKLTAIEELDLRMLSELELRISKMTTEEPRLNDPKFKMMGMQVIRHVLVSLFNDKNINHGLKYHLADKFENTVNDLIYIKGNSDTKQILKDDINFISNKKEELKGFRKGVNLDEFWELMDKEWNRGKDLTLPFEFVQALDKTLKEQKLIAENDNLELTFTIKPIAPGQKVHWLGSQIALVFMLNVFSDGPVYNNQSLYNFIADRFLIKDKPVTARKINNTHFNLIKKYFGSKKTTAPESFKTIIQILKKAFELSKK